MPFADFVKKFNNPKSYLIVANVFLVFFLIILSNLGILPVKNTGDFIFLTILALAFALYRPGWAFLFFAGTIALENINLAPESIEINIRPYQLIGGLAIFSILIRIAFKRLNFKLPKLNWADGLIAAFAIAGFLSAFGAIDKSASLKQSIILASFAALYFLVRIFIQNLDDLKKIIPFFLSSSVIVIFYGLWQNIRFTKGFTHFEVMPGRPNSTFTEADWLGIYLVLVLAVVYSLICRISNFKFQISNQALSSNDKKVKKLLVTSYWLLVTIIFILLILTVSRSAWLGALAVTIVFLFLIFTNLKINPRNWEWKETLRIKLPIIACFIASVAIVYVFNLTNFQLFNRIQSTGTGLQEITASCPMTYCLLMSGNENDLKYCNCYQINLEDIEKEKAIGRRIEKVYRHDPNTNIRREIYRKSWAEIKKHPILGVGWGNISSILGKDERGTELNSSNIFLEVWLGAGLLGITSFLLFLLIGIIRSIKCFLTNEFSEEKVLGLFLILGFFALLIPNLFNAGVFLGIIWLFFGMTKVNELDI